MRRIGFKVAAAACLFLAGCSSTSDMVYRPYPQILPQHISKLAVQPFINKTGYLGLEDKLTQAVINEFLRNGNFPIVPQTEANGVIVGEIRRYILTPIQYDAALVPTLYKLDILLDIKFYDKQANAYLWEEPAFQGIQTYSASTLPGGMTEEQAREAIWDMMSRDIVKRTISGFGEASSPSQRRLSLDTPNISSSTISTTTAPGAQ